MSTIQVSNLSTFTMTALHRSETLNAGASQTEEVTVFYSGLSRHLVKTKISVHIGPDTLHVIYSVINANLTYETVINHSWNGLIPRRDLGRTYRTIIIIYLISHKYKFIVF